MPHERLRRAILAIATIVLGLAVAEAASYVALPRSGATDPVLYVADAVRGTALRPGYRGVITRSEHRFEVAINARGYRDTEWRLDDRRPRILLIGSSATFGVGLSQEESLAGQLAHDLAPEFLVLNTGTYTYGLPAELLTIRRECPETHPLLVLYIHEYKNTRADFLELRPPPPEDAASEPQPAPDWGPTLPALRAMLSLHGLHPRQIAERLVGLDRLSDSYVARYANTTGPGYAPQNAVRAAGLIRQMSQAAQLCGAEFRVVIMPGPGEAYYGMREPATTALLTALAGEGISDQVIDARQGVPRGSAYFLAGHDYPDAVGAARLAAAIAPHAAQAAHVVPQ